MGIRSDQASIKKRARRADIRCLPTSTILSIFASLTYLTCRLVTILSAPACATIWAVLLLEIATAGTSHAVSPLSRVTDTDPVPRLFTYLAVFSAARKAEGDRLPRIAKGNDLPSVDVFVTYCGEGLDIITNTVRASCRLDYPQSLYRVVVLDDSHSTKLAEAIAELRKLYPNLYYTSRNIRVQTHSKAANLNFGLRYVEDLRRGKSKYVAVLDVDMIPLPHWLRTTLPHVYNNPHVGLACPTQSYYNLPYNDPLSVSYDIHSINYFLHLQDYSNNAFCTGTGFVVRRSALESIGGFPEESIQEDFLTSLHLAAKGWETVYLVREKVQWGLAPDTFAGWVKQRQRWGAGVISISQFLCSKRAEGLAADVRLNGALWGVVDGSAAFVWTVALVGLPVLVMTQQPLVAWSGTIQLNVLLGLAFLDFAAQSLTQVLLSSLLDFKMPFLGQFASTWTAPYRLAVALRFYVLPKLVGSKTPNFTPTNIPMHGDRERAARTAGSLVARLKVILWDCGAYLHLVVLVICVIGGVLTVQVVGRQVRRQTVNLVLQGLLAGVGWPPLFLFWAAFLKNAWVPVAYAIAPPALLPRKHFLTRDGGNGVAYPTAQAKEDHLQRGGQGLFYFVCFYYGLVLAVYRIA